MGVSFLETGARLRSGVAGKRIAALTLPFGRSRELVANYFSPARPPSKIRA
jgi:hypothetical protein